MIYGNFNLNLDFNFNLKAIFTFLVLTQLLTGYQSAFQAYESSANFRFTCFNKWTLGILSSV